MDLSEKLLRAEADRYHSDADNGIPKFSVVYDDPEAGTYAVQMKRYIDADRAGFCGYVDEIIYDDLDQVTASEIAEKLTQYKREAHEAYMARYR